MSAIMAALATLARVSYDAEGLPEPRREWMREQCVQARIEADQLRADLATAETGLKDAQWRLGELRIKLATVTAERDAWSAAFGPIDIMRPAWSDSVMHALPRERTAHAETRHCLEHALRREQTARGELATAEARVKVAEPFLNRALDLCEKLDAPSSVACDIERALEALRG